MALSQSLAIAEYLEELHPDPPLLPVDAGERAQVRAMMAVVACDIHPLQNLRVLNYLRDNFVADDESIERWIRRWIGDGFSAIESMLAARGAAGPFACGESPTLADAWLVPQVYNARRFKVDITPFPRIGAIDTHCLTLDAFARAVPENQPDAPA
jgi:maleylpyruvate isomerase